MKDISFLQYIYTETPTPLITANFCLADNLGFNVTDEMFLDQLAINWLLTSRGSDKLHPTRGGNLLSTIGRSMSTEEALSATGDIQLCIKNTEKQIQYYQFYQNLPARAKLKILEIPRGQRIVYDIDNSYWFIPIRRVNYANNDRVLPISVGTKGQVTLNGQPIGMAYERS